LSRADLRPTTSRLFPYTTLFRSRRRARRGCAPNPHGMARVPATRLVSHLRQDESPADPRRPQPSQPTSDDATWVEKVAAVEDQRSEEHTSELQSHLKLVCRLLLV